MNERDILLGSGAVFCVLLVIAIIIGDLAISANLVFLGVVILLAPYSLYKFFEFKKIKAYEDSLPSFLRDLAEAQRAGLTILQAIKMASKSDYGPLSPEVKVMADQLSWNVTLEEALKNFSRKMQKSRNITRAIMIIEQANKSGGNIEDAMESLSSNMELIKDVQQEKATLMNEQVMMMYAIFFIFLGISIALVKFLIPIVQTQSTEGFGLMKGYGSDPCVKCVDSSESSCIGCSIFYTISDGHGLREARRNPVILQGALLYNDSYSGIFLGADSRANRLGFCGCRSET